MSLPDSRIILGFIAGGVWSGLNLLLLKQLAALLSSPTPSRRRLVLLLIAKFGGLYPFGIWVLWSRVVSPWAFAAGFTVVLAGFAFRVAVPALSRSSSHV